MSTAMPAGDDVADDILIGAVAIAIFMFGTPLKTRRVFHLAETSNMPFFKIGSMLALRKSKFLEHIEEQEQKHQDSRPPASAKRERLTSW